MKKLITIFLILILCGFSGDPTYVPDPNSILTINITNPDSIVSNGWGLTGPTCAGCASYYWKITRSKMQIKAEDNIYYYYYYIWVFSNSYYSDGYKASTYLTDLDVYMDDELIYNIEYTLATGEQRWVGWARSTNGNESLSFEIEKISVY